MVVGITEVLNLWAEMGVFSYVIPFLLIFAVVFAILKKTKILGEDNNAINAIIAISIGLLSLLNDHVPIFFENIFPKFGIGLSVFLVLIILLGFFYHPAATGQHPMKWIGYLTGIGVVVWALTSWDDWGLAGYGVSSWLSDYFWSLIILGGIITVIVLVARKPRATP